MSRATPSEHYDISFVIPCYGSLRTIGFTLKSIQQQCSDLAYEVIVVDSSEASISDWLRSHFPRVRLINSEKRLFPGAARNRGAEQARAPLLAFVDADTILDPDWLARLHTRLAGDDEIRIVGGCVRNQNPGTLASRVLYWIEFSEFLPGEASGPRPFLSSSNLMIGRREFLLAGGFDESYAMSEDLIFSRSIGGGLFFDGSVGVSHLHRSKWSQVLRHLRRLGYWSGRLRRDRRVSASWLVRRPALALLLPFYRLPLIIRRVATHDALRVSAGSPFLFVGLTAWASGFRRGVAGRKL